MYKSVNIEEILNSETFNLLQQTDWGQIYKRLTLYAIRRAQFYGCTDIDTNMLAGRDFTVDDIDQHVIEKTLCGERKWDPSQIALLPWLKNHVNSVMDAWIKLESGKYEFSFGEDENESEELNEPKAS